MQANWIEYTSSTGGTGALTLAAVTGEPTWAAWLGAAGTRTVQYVIVETASNKYEAGIGSIDLATSILTRTLPRSTWDGTTAAGASAAALSFSTAGVRVLCLPLADVDPYFPTVVTAAPGSALGFSPPHANAFANGTVTASREYYLPVRWPGGPLATVGININTAATGTVKWAVYDTLATGFPGAKILDGGANTFNTGTTGDKTASANIDLPRGPYWVGLIFSGAPVARGEGAGTAPHFGGVVTGTPLVFFFFAGSYTTGLPDPATAAASLSATSTSKVIVYLAPGS